jgi:hypothetical protein
VCSSDLLRRVRGRKRAPHRLTNCTASMYTVKALSVTTLMVPPKRRQRLPPPWHIQPPAAPVVPIFFGVAPRGRTHRVAAALLVATAVCRGVSPSKSAQSKGWRLAQRSTGRNFSACGERQALHNAHHHCKNACPSPRPRVVPASTMAPHTSVRLTGHSRRTGSHPSRTSPTPCKHEQHKLAPTRAQGMRPPQARKMGGGHNLLHGRGVLGLNCKVQWGPPALRLKV